jgi:hypothetical protein
MEICTSESLVPEPNLFEVEIAIATMKIYKSSGSDQIPAELIHAGGETLCYEIHKLVNSIWNKKELPDQWKESIILPIYKKSDKIDCNNYRGISLLSASYKIVFNVILTKLSPYVQEITGDHPCGFRRNE